MYVPELDGGNYTEVCDRSLSALPRRTSLENNIIDPLLKHGSTPRGRPPEHEEVSDAGSDTSSSAGGL